VPAYLRKGETFAELAAGFRGRHHDRVAVCGRDRDAAGHPGRPSSARQVRDATKAGYAYVVLDGTLIPIDRRCGRGVSVGS
jgi:hypothetical protein